MVHFVTFPLSTSSSKMGFIPNMFQWMNYLKDVTVETAKEVEKCELARAKCKIKLDEAVLELWAAISRNLHLCK
ncbi:hypothetical protein BD770DRAFT_27942 [Pilaira anomala]|nr:hypothetical protein BD770DRAFT_27942 [Pilaira anomala]